MHAELLVGRSRLQLGVLVMKKWMIITLLVATSAHAEEVKVTAAPAIEVAVALEPDVAQRLAEVERDAANVAPPQLEAVLERALVTYEATDPFSIAQRPAAKPRTLAVLSTIADRAKAGGELVTAARALDARWALSGGRDVQLGEVLATWAERDADPAQALYLARRARLADPSNRAAERIDDKLSTNQRALTGRLAVLAGIAAVVVGGYLQYRVGQIESDLALHPRSGADVNAALAERDRDDLIGTSLVIAAPILTVGGVIWMWSGTPKSNPMSPGELPALVQR